MLPRLLHLALWALLPAMVVASTTPPANSQFKREAGRCAMRDSCGRKSTFGGELPCPDNDLAQPNEDATFLATLADICGEDFPTTTCCTMGQLEVLSASLQQAEPLIATCPACRSNFRHFYCSFTCSPDQSLFLSVTETQRLSNGKDAVKAVEMDVAPSFGEGFFNSCKDVKFGATNGYAMDLLGGGAKSYLPFLRYMGQERALGSPFQINFPSPSFFASTLATELDEQHPFPPPSTNTTFGVPFADKPLSCADTGLNARCACPDCPSVCAVLPPIESPEERYKHRCKVGKMSCFAFSLTILYAVTLVACTVLLAVSELWARRGGVAAGVKDEENGWTRLRNRLSFAGVGGRWSRSPSASGYDQLPLEDPLAGEFDESPTVIGGRRGQRGGGGGSGRNSLVGATSTAGAQDGEDLASQRTTNSSSNHNSLSSRRQLGQGASLLAPSPSEPSPFLQPRTYPLNTALSNIFYRLGLFCARSPWLTLALGCVVCGVVNLGWGRFEVEKDPVRLWVAKGSPAERAKATFEEGFGSFYRTEQIFLSVAPTSPHVSTLDLDLNSDLTVTRAPWTAVDAPVLNFPRLQFLARTEAQIRALTSSPSNLTLSSVCFSPATDPAPPTDSTGCVVQSLMGYFGDSLDGVTEDTWADQLNQCATTPAACLPSFGQPLNVKLVLGGVPTPDQEGDLLQADQARAIVITYVVRNSLDKDEVARAEEWEAELQKFLHELARPGGEAQELGLQVAFSTGLSLEEELSASTNTDVPIVVLSYIFMFLYVAINLGSSGSGLAKALGRGLFLLGASLVQLVRMIPLPRRAGGRARSNSLNSLAGSTSGMGAYFKRQVLVDSKFLLGLWGIIIVLLSVSTSVALCSAMGVKVTLVIAEVIPFLVLAIGVDNVFILSHELDQQNARAYATAARHGPLFGEDQQEDDPEGLPPAEERVARALGRMGPSILLSASCEIVAFGLGAMVGMPAVRNFAIYAAGAVLVNALLQVTIFVSAMAIDLRRIESNRIDCFPCFKLSQTASLDLGATVTEGWIARFIRQIFAPTILLKPIKYLIMALFSGLFVLSWIGARHIELGLDQRLALPSSSYLVDYFNAVDSFLDVGPPVYFVTRDINFTALQDVKRVCGRFSTCNDFSLANVLEAERKRPESSFVAEPPAVWIDDFFQWLNPLLEDCCRVKKRNPSEFCTPEDSDFACRPCFEDRDPAWSITLDGLPEGQEFMSLLDHWLESPTDESCPLGGKAGYSSALTVDDSSVKMSHFRTFHTPLKTQSDFIEAYAAASRIAADLSKRTGGEVFPYSLFYVFFASYGNLWSTTREVLVFALFAVFLVTSILLGSFRTGAVVVLTVFLTVTNVMGVMGVWRISLNPISLVNLVISVGIAVEFCSHIARAFMGASGGGLPYDHPAGERDRDERAWQALVDVGSSVVSGITVTKLIGISVLALTRSKLLETYFFRMWLALIISGALHGLVFLPVALSLFGGQGYALTADDGDGSWISSAVGSRYEHENRGFLAEDDDDDSDEY
ncbi:sterol-sensing domain of SREBP cleavage-activation-domain-containing protein [Leucosporidium creatinivorum]|uniref:Sterol-sensing domain of SREBP cleavage-activation-domain-containing protein n=1 Tax=Leucosporidium creatinivorum TaxID=106004 RepID=A0A1Y2FN25_9BASI|nr:sterol-sensing domain of SREBP cleavage-activation-domain-containing protein [Leucosporidium creatinivorum]